MVSEDTAIPDNQAGVPKQHLVLRLRAANHAGCNANAEKPGMASDQFTKRHGTLPAGGSSGRFPAALARLASVQVALGCRNCVFWGESGSQQVVHPATLWLAYS